MKKRDLLIEIQKLQSQVAAIQGRIPPKPYEPACGTIGSTFFMVGPPKPDLVTRDEMDKLREEMRQEMLEISRAEEIRIPVTNKYSQVIGMTDAPIIPRTVADVGQCATGVTAFRPQNIYRGDTVVGNTGQFASMPDDLEKVIKDACAVLRVNATRLRSMPEFGSNRFQTADSWANSATRLEQAYEAHKANEYENVTRSGELVARYQQRIAELEGVIGSSCDQCCGRKVWVRGRHPGEDRREVCATCATEQLEDIHSTHPAAQAAAASEGKE